MRLATIKNRYLFKDDNPNGIHTYGVYYDKPTKRYRAVGLTHLYIKDNKRFIQVRRGNLLIMDFKEFETPSGVKNSYFDKNVNGGKIDVYDKNNVKFLSNRFLSKSQSDTIKNFATRKEK
ncbi:MAG: hypothetical protein J6C97_03950 [Clostridia bacterium]|nr:hypothetical protein [Clostridia bacterium]